MLIQRVDKYYDKEKYDLNCAETIVYAANEEYNMNLNTDTLKSVAAFGGGMAVEDICGALTGSLVVISILFTKERAHESDFIKKLTIEFIEKYKAKLKTFNCKELKILYKTDELRCTVMVEAAAEVLDEIVLREKAQAI
jgi:C_GCAxxG_C_C family probable redox protein